MLRFFSFTGILLLLASTAMAHTPLCSCFDGGDGTITCEGAFSDGSSASGVKMRVESPEKKILVEGKMSEFSDFNFEIPKGDFNVIFDAGEGHRLTIPRTEILD